MRTKSDVYNFCSVLFIFIKDNYLKRTVAYLALLVLGPIYLTHKNVKWQLLTITKA